MKGIVGFLIRMLVLNIVLVPLMVFGPALYVIPIFSIAANPQDNFSGLAQLYFWLGPLSAAFYMCVSCHLPSVCQWRREGLLKTWREDHGGLLHTAAKSTLYMFGGLFLSYLFEVLFVLAFSRVPFSSRVAREVAGFALMPFATFAPVILLWLCRWMRNVREEMAH
jgi:hypothetical protein